VESLTHSEPRPHPSERGTTARAPLGIQDDLKLKVEQPGQVRLSLQQRAPRNLRRHVLRGVVRFCVLLVADLAAFALMRAALRAVRDGAALGAEVAGWVRDLFPAGYLNGWQFATALFVGLLVTRTYGPGDMRRNPGRLFAACALAAALPLWTSAWAIGPPPVVVQYGLTVVLVWFVLVAERLGIDRVVAAVRSPAKDAGQTLFVGPASECRRVSSGSAFTPNNGYQAIGFVDLESPPATGALGTVSDFAVLLAASGAEAVVVCGELPNDQFCEVVDATLAAGCQLLSAPGALELAGVEPTVVWRQGQPLVRLTAPSLQGQQLVIKRLIDVLGSAFALALVGPLFGAISVLIKLDSRGPVLFRQARVGRGGRTFRIIKFRTMVDGAEARRDALLDRSLYRDPRLFKMPDDPRTTRVGRWLRRTSLDELPQLVNVLKGEMSLVGPRPPLPSEVELYERHHYARFDAKPGMTGPWQVSGRNRVTDFEQVVALETRYIREWSLLSDLGILLRTFEVVFRMRGAH
jgi:exopolysaccharide biosynthesis polyprenyl glycosylphosphotransferase